MPEPGSQVPAGAAASGVVRSPALSRDTGSQSPDLVEPVALLSVQNVDPWDRWPNVELIPMPDQVSPGPVALLTDAPVDDGGVSVIEFGPAAILALVCGALGGSRQGRRMVYGVGVGVVLVALSVMGAIPSLLRAGGSDGRVPGRNKDMRLPAHLSAFLALAAMVLTGPLPAHAQTQPRPTSPDRIDLVGLTTAQPSPDAPPNEVQFQATVNYQLQSATSGLVLLFLFENSATDSSQQSSDGIAVQRGIGRLVWCPGLAAWRLKRRWRRD